MTKQKKLFECYFYWCLLDEIDWIVNDTRDRRLNGTDV